MTDERPMASEIEGQKLPFPAAQSELDRQPMSDLSSYSPANKLLGKVALVTGAGSGVGRAVAMAFAMEGAGGRRARRLHANVTHDVLGLDAYGLLEAWNDSASR